MRLQNLCLAIACLLLLALALPTYAYWPTNRFDNVAVAADSSLPERGPYAFPYPNGSTMVTFWRGIYGIGYQLIDRYGDTVYPEPQSIWPAVSSPYTEHPVAISDQMGGVIVCWRSYPGGAIPYAYFAQRLDSLGNRLWGESAATIYLFDDDNEWDVCPDGSGGLYFTTSCGNISQGQQDLRLQHINSLGQPLLGDSGLVAIAAPQNQYNPKLAPDGHGGVYIAWEDHRPPYQFNGAIFVGRFDTFGQQVWPIGGGTMLRNTVSPIRSVQTVLGVSSF